VGKTKKSRRPLLNCKRKLDNRVRVSKMIEGKQVSTARTGDRYDEEGVLEKRKGSFTISESMSEGRAKEATWNDLAFCKFGPGK